MIIVIAVIKISRPINFLITFFSIVVAGIICSTNEINWSNILLAGFTGSIVGSAGNIINDIFDFEIDKINRPERILPSGKLSIKSAWLLYFLLIIVSIILSFLINAAAFGIVIFTNLFIFFYSYQIKKLLLFGNFVVSFFTGLAFIFGGVAVGNWKEGLIPAAFAFLTNFIREIVKDIEDIKGDQKEGIITFPQKYGLSSTLILVNILTFILFLLTLVPFLFRLYDIMFFVIVMPFANSLLLKFLYDFNKLKGKSNFRRLSNTLKIVMIIGIIGIYFGNVSL